MQLLIKIRNKIYGLFLVAKSLSVNFFKPKFNLEEELEEFVKESLSHEEIVAKLEYILSARKTEKFDVYDLIKTAKNLSKNIVNEKSIYTTIFATIEEMSSSYDAILNSIFYYSGIVSDFKNRGINNTKFKIQEFNKYSESVINEHTSTIEENKIQIQRLEESNKMLASLISETKKRNGEFNKNMLKVEGLIDTLSVKKLNELKEERQKCLKFIK